MDSLAPPPAKKNRREQHYAAKYGEEFSFICSSRVSSLYAFCKICRKDINISHGGRSRQDIVQHAKTSTHLKMLRMEEEGKKSNSMKLQHCKHKHIAALHTTECNS